MIIQDLREAKQVIDVCDYSLLYYLKNYQIETNKEVKEALKKLIYVKVKELKANKETPLGILLTEFVNSDSDQVAYGYTLHFPKVFIITDKENKIFVEYVDSKKRLDSVLKDLKRGKELNWYKKIDLIDIDKVTHLDLKSF